MSAFTKVLAYREAIENARATLRYLPQYSSDLNLIEMPFSKFKAFLRRAAERTIPGLRRAIRSFLPRLGRENVPTTSGMRAMLQYDRETL